MIGNTTRRARGTALVLSLIVVLSAVGMSALAGTVAADGHDVDATLSDEEYSEVGDEVTVQLDIDSTDDGSLSYISTSFEIAYDDSALEFVDAEATGLGDVSLAGGNGTFTVLSMESGEISDDTGVSITFEVTDHVEEADLTFTGDGNNYVASSDGDYDVAWNDGTIAHAHDWWAPYVDDEGVVDTSGLQTAITDWSSGDLDTGQLQDLIASWSNGQPVDELAS